MTRQSFLRTKFQILPYSKGERHPSTSFAEGFSIRIDNLVLNFHWENETYCGFPRDLDEGTVKVAVVDTKKHQREWSTRLFTGLKTLSEKKLEECFKLAFNK